MPIFTRRHRDSYLRTLAAEPLFRGVPRHLIAVVGRSVDPVSIAAGDALSCDLSRETLLLADGHVLLADATGRAIAAVGAPGAIDGGAARALSGCRIVAASPTRAYVVARRELRALAAVAPGVAAALAGSEMTTHWLAGRGVDDGATMVLSAARSAPGSAHASRS